VLDATEHHAIVKVKDTGCGISQDVGDHIFEKFYQGDTSRSTEGNGLGLALVKKVIDLIGGEILVKSKVGVGSTFIIKLKS
jgi:signal transduction histidine kinase